MKKEKRFLLSKGIFVTFQRNEYVQKIIDVAQNLES